NLKSGWVPLFVRVGKETPDGNVALLNMGARAIEEGELNDMAQLRSILSAGHAGEGPRLSAGGRTEAASSSNEEKDLFEIVWPLIEKALGVPKTSDELSA